ncbi:hypothetical protein Pcinc_018234 [Petrolisthes cinctipes]|uniref:Uncharacterized protein n=1 Tax=Petrolisthes cinctipes TaxID=88211 RepID=A0AAE1FMK6_PETCI|nr:hypothetical protein Pcinc_018234 [Petrolisthes cinctipes]
MFLGKKKTTVESALEMITIGEHIHKSWKENRTETRNAPEILKLDWHVIKQRVTTNSINGDAGDTSQTDKTPPMYRTDRSSRMLSVQGNIQSSDVLMVARGRKDPKIYLGVDVLMVIYLCIGGPRGTRVAQHAIISVIYLRPRVPS